MEVVKPSILYTYVISDVGFLRASDKSELDHEIWDHEGTGEFKYPFMKISVVVPQVPWKLVSSTC